MDRRKFLQASGASLAALSTTGARARKITPPDASPDVIVVGAGTFGAWTAYHLNRLGATVTLLDAYGPGNSRASSGGETRQIQSDRTTAEYTKSAKASYAWWKRLETEVGKPLLLNTGKLMISTAEEGRDRAESIQRYHNANGIPGTEILTADEVRRRWPQIHADDIAWAMFSHGPGGATIKARQGVEAVANQLVRNGGQMRIAHGTPVLDDSNNVRHVKLQDDSTLSAAQYVFACGPWLKRVFPEFLSPRLRVERRDVLWFGSPPGDARFAYPNMPNWSVIGSGYYGFPDIESRGFKVAPYPDLNTIDMDTDERLILPHNVKRGRKFLAHRFPALAQMPVTETRVCQITNTSDSHFIADRYPGTDNVWIVGGGSGHGFKHGPAVGEHVAKRVLGQDVDPNFTKSFHSMKDEFA